MASLEQGNGVWPEEEAAVAALRNLFPSDKESYGMPLDDACLVRYLRARENNVEKASTMLTATLEWRQEFGLPEVRKSYLLPHLQLSFADLDELLGSRRNVGGDFLG